ncbi:MAG: hypothetical protein P1U67_05935 [Alcanivoracaceae bacterium]|nr:hypothetical protein [Alcanivoracaceae bacterium]
MAKVLVRYIFLEDATNIDPSRLMRHAARLQERFDYSELNNKNVPLAGTAQRNTIMAWSLAAEMYQGLGMTTDFFTGLHSSVTGKPLHPDVSFSIAHTRNMIVVAMSRSVTVGIDVETTYAFEQLPPQADIHQMLVQISGTADVTTWVAAEAVLKASENASVDNICDVSLTNGQARLGKKRFWCHAVSLPLGWCCQLATNEQEISVMLSEASAATLLAAPNELAFTS